MNSLSQGIGLSPFCLALVGTRCRGSISSRVGWQCRKRQIGFRPRALAMPSVVSKPNERWTTDLTRVWYG